MSRLHAVVTGLVQGVFYRASVQEHALALGLTGWVKNRDDGAVELIAEGYKDDLGALLAWCGEGPPLAEVSSVLPSWSAATGEFESFEIVH